MIRIAKYGLLLLLVGSFSAFAQTASQQQSLQPRDITSKLLCPCGCDSMLLSSCFCGTSQALHADIQDQIDAGQTAEQITAGLVAQYGKEMWAAPPAEGFDVVAWIMPGVIILVLLVIFVWLIKSQLMRRRPEPSAHETAQADKYLQKIQEDLKNYESDR